MSSISAGVNVNINRPVSVSSQLHTPLNVRGSPQMDSAAIGAMAAVKRETNIVDPLSRIVDPGPQFESDSSRLCHLEKQNSDPLPKAKTFGDILLMKISLPPLDIATIPCTIAGLQTLARVNAWKHVVAMSEQLLASKDSSSFANEGTQFNIVFRLRMTAYFRLKMFDELVQEASSVLASEEQRISSIQNRQSAGFSYDRPNQGVGNCDKLLALQLLLIEARAMTGRGEEALQQLFALRQWLCDDNSTDESPVNDEILWWKWRVQWSIINTLSKQRQWRQTIFELQTILRDVQWKRSQLVHPAKTLHSLVSLLSSEVLILCRLSRTLLQMGAIESASSYARRASDIGMKLASSRVANIHDHCLLALALVAFAKDKIEEACELFEKIMTNEFSRRSQEKVESPIELLFPILSEGASQSMPSNQSFSLFRHPLAGALEIEESTLAAAVNNYAICSLYLRRIHEAVAKMEDLIQDDPTQNLIDPIVFNLCTMYDLSCAPDISVEKKKALQEVANHYHIEDLHWKSFRLN